MVLLVVEKTLSRNSQPCSLKARVAIGRHGFCKSFLTDSGKNLY
jgi:hypothetical protein